MGVEMCGCFFILVFEQENVILYLHSMEFGGHAKYDLFIMLFIVSLSAFGLFLLLFFQYIEKTFDFYFTASKYFLGVSVTYGS